MKGTQTAGALFFFMERMIFIYALCDPRTDEIRYIGKTQQPQIRLNVHLRCSGDTRKDRWIRKVIDSGLDPYMRILCEIPESWWPGYEQEFIRLHGSARLVNSAPGGKGGATRLGAKLSPEVRAKISASRVGKTHAGFSPSEETRAKISASLLGKSRSKESIRKQQETIRKNKIIQQALAEEGYVCENVKE